MQVFRTIRFTLLALLLSITAASLHAQIGVSINVGFAPPALPIYEQPYCPQPNLMWTPGYWAYSNSYGDYYWVPGGWVPAPYSGALWTPPYWGFYGGRYGFHRGYWGRHVGYYGGVDYGFGFGGIGFAGGEWRGSNFAYNTAVVHVNQSFVHTTYVNENAVRSGIVANPNRVAYSGGPGGIQHTASPAEQVAARESHTAPTSAQTHLEASAMGDKSSFAKANGGRPGNVVVARPSALTNASPATSGRAAQPTMNEAPKAQVQQHSAPAAHSAPAVARTDARPAEQPKSTPQVQQHSAPAPRAAPAERTAPARQPLQEQHAAPPQRAVQEQRQAAPVQRAAPAQRSAPEQRAPSAPHAEQAQRPAQQQHAAPAQREAPPAREQPKEEPRPR